MSGHWCPLLWLDGNADLLKFRFILFTTVVRAPILGLVSIKIGRGEEANWIFWKIRNVCFSVSYGNLWDKAQDLTVNRFCRSAFLHGHVFCFPNSFVLSSFYCLWKQFPSFAVGQTCQNFAPRIKPPIFLIISFCVLPSSVQHRSVVGLHCIFI